MRVWSSRQKKSIKITVDYGKVEVGDFTLFHIARMRDELGNDTQQTLPSPRAVV